ncbi:DUF2637 domain-containing protein [Streptomyces sp. CB03238]|uniref:DUF2637 domain-containing protein n=1 Tax=Streptomyces sp. CB03238 TaxID=1907777 RepID=UPI000A10A038|nr:DUF2637 domain-containing protein [Streptomyces sp. CB03238]ORT54190.1 hypothetical protein BKD26_35960 [Streptomyces sp. CB03238]
MDEAPERAPAPEHNDADHRSRREDAPATARRRGWWPDEDKRKELLNQTLAAVTTLGTYGLIGLGFSTSYESIRQIAQVKGKFGPTMSHVVPLSFEGGIIILSLYVIRAARQGQRALMLETLVMVGSLATLFVNWHAPVDGIEGRITHVVPVAMFLICFKYLVHSSRKKALQDRGVLPPPLPRLRGVEWLLAPFDAYAQWRLMALNGVPTQEQAMWVHHAMQLRRVQLLRKHKVKRWWRVPLHERLQAAAEVLAEGERLYGTDGGGGRYAVLAERLSEPEKVPEPTSAPVLPAIPQQASARPELEPLEESSALPPSTSAYSEPLPQAERPYTSETTDEVPAAAVVESSSERADREEREATNRAQQRRDTYQKALEVVMELIELGEPITGARVAQHPDFPAGERTAQRSINRMREDPELAADPRLRKYLFPEDSNA